MKQLIFNVVQQSDKKGKFVGPGERTLRAIPDTSCDRVFAALLDAGMHHGELANPKNFTYSHFRTDDLYALGENRNTFKWLYNKMYNWRNMEPISKLKPFICPSFAFAKEILLNPNLDGSIAFGLMLSNSKRRHQGFVNFDISQIDIPEGEASTKTADEWLNNIRQPNFWIRGSHGDEFLPVGTKSFFARTPWTPHETKPYTQPMGHDSYEPAYLWTHSFEKLPYQTPQGPKDHWIVWDAGKKRHILDFLTEPGEWDGDPVSYIQNFYKFQHKKIDGKDYARQSGWSILWGFYSPQNIFDRYDLKDYPPIVGKKEGSEVSESAELPVEQVLEETSSYTTTLLSEVDDV